MKKFGIISAIAVLALTMVPSVAFAATNGIAGMGPN